MLKPLRINYSGRYRVQWWWGLDRHWITSRLDGVYQKVKKDCLEINAIVNQRNNKGRVNPRKKGKKNWIMRWDLGELGQGTMTGIDGGGHGDGDGDKANSHNTSCSSKGLHLRNSNYSTRYSQRRS